MIKIMFLCHGNICRSPIAEFVFKDISKDFSDKLLVDSKAVSSEEIGNPIYPPAKRILEKKNVPFTDHRASKFTLADYENYDYVIIMEEYNRSRLMQIIGSDKDNKVYKLLDFTETPGDIEDPWYSGRFESVFEQIKYGCTGLLKHIMKELE